MQNEIQQPDLTATIKNSNLDHVFGTLEFEHSYVVYRNPDNDDITVAECRNEERVAANLRNFGMDMAARGGFLFWIHSDEAFQRFLISCDVDEKGNVRVDTGRIYYQAGNAKDPSRVSQIRRGDGVDISGVIEPVQEMLS